MSRNYVDLEQVELEASQRWDTDASIRREFTSKAAYVAFQKADARGQVKILGRGFESSSKKAGD